MRTEAWRIIEHPTWEVAVSAAGSEAATTMASSAPVILYQQSSRQFLVASFPLPFIADRVKIDNLKKGEDPDAHYNRPLIPEHIRAIEEYLVDQKNYILPPITLCVEDALTVHVPKSSSTVKTGIVVLPHTLQFIVTDGQHRIKGIQQAFKRNQNLAKDAIGVTIVNEVEMDKVHQDFVDCAQTKAISPALLTAFNVRDPLARVVREVAKEVVVFKDRIEKVATTVGKNSVNLFTMNQLRQGVAELLVGDSTPGQGQLRRDVIERIPDDAMMEHHLRRICEFYRKFAAANAQWTQIVLAAERPAEDLVDTKTLRETYLHFNSTGLVIISRVGHYILQQDPANQTQYLEALANLDWRRSAEMWAGNVISADGKLITQNSPVGAAVVKVKRAIGLDLTAAETKRELERERKEREREEAAALELEVQDASKEG
jgi:DGQHR domain-containing protein